ncbi:DNA oxidative demethylase AlkB [Variovorax sp. LT1R16]|uniref:DNA oxidative demethylase AlkB n=1 Tax=Variovorax sp. LT1R16 TaxID=3443728 RepID=UPI003F47B781
MRTLSLFDDEAPLPDQRLGPQAVVLRAFARPSIDALLTCIDALTAVSPFRRMVTPGGFTMSVALTNCGALGWTTDSRGYRYAAVDPLTGQPWPAMPDALARLAHDAAEAAGFAGFQPDACLINRYEPGARLALHQDKDERDYGAPIVSVSLGMTARFLFGGLERAHKAQQVALQHGDVVVWGGADRLRYHGVLPLQGEAHPRLGLQRINLTFRQAG